MKKFLYLSLVQIDKSFRSNFCVKARIIADRKLIRIALIRINLRSLLPSILRSFYARNFIKTFCQAVLVPFALEASSHKLEFEGDVLYWTRNGVSHHRLLENSSSQTEVSTKNLVDDFDWKLGGRGSLRVLHEKISTLELSYLYITPWKTEKTIHRSGSIFYTQIDPDISLDYTNSGKISGKYTSAFQSAELTYWSHVTPQRTNCFSFSWIIGGSWILLKEKFNIQFEPETSTLSNHIKTDNSLYGLIAGAQLEYNPSQHWTWAFSVKGAGYLDDAKNHNRVTYNSITAFSHKKKRYTDSYLIEGEASLSYHLGKFLSLSIGYQGFMLTGVALAPNQVGQHHNHCNVEGDIVINGGYAGLTLEF